MKKRKLCWNIDNLSGNISMIMLIKWIQDINNPFLIFTLLTGIVAFLSKGIKSTIVYAIPLENVAILSYVSYQFRITVILRGHL